MDAESENDLHAMMKCIDDTCVKLHACPSCVMQHLRSRITAFISCPGYLFEMQELESAYLFYLALDDPSDGDRAKMDNIKKGLLPSGQGLPKSPQVLKLQNCIHAPPLHVHGFHPSLHACSAFSSDDAEPHARGLSVTVAGVEHQN